MNSSQNAAKKRALARLKNAINFSEYRKYMIAHGKAPTRVDHALLNAQRKSNIRRWTNEQATLNRARMYGSNMNKFHINQFSSLLDKLTPDELLQLREALTGRKNPTKRAKREIVNALNKIVNNK